MKKFLGVVFVLSFVALLIAAPRLTRGFGTPAVATTTVMEIKFFEDAAPCLAGCVSILNSGDSTVFCAVNTSSNAFNVSQAIPVIKNASFDFKDEKISLGSIFIKTTNGTANVYIGAF